MGNPRTVHYACALAASIFLTGCKPVVGRDEAEQIAERHSEIALIKARADIARLEQKLAKIEPRIAFLEAMEDLNGKAIDNVSNQVSHNAKVANNNALQDMTSSGTCGSERVNYPDGSWSIRNRECTLKDMRR